MRLAFGANLRQRVEPVREVLRGEPIPLHVPAGTPLLDRRMLSAAVVALGGVALAGFALARASRGKSKA
jgi:hypothetical protein